MKVKVVSRRKFSGRGYYGRRMDPEVVKLCDALNSLPSVKTVESCCGHGERPFAIWLRIDSSVALRFLGRCLSHRYWTYGHNWTLKVDNDDTTKAGAIFLLHSGKIRGEEAYAQAEDLVSCMEDHLNHERYLESFNIDLSGFEFEME